MAKTSSGAGWNGNSSQLGWSKGMSKRQAIQLAIMELGLDSSRKNVQEHIKDKVGFIVSSNHIGVEKAKLMRDGVFNNLASGKKAKKPAAPRTRRPAAIKPVIAAEVVMVDFSGIDLNDILLLRDLVRRIGVNPMHTLLDAFA